MPVKTSFSFADDLWAADVDTGQISQVIQNLCLNASQAMPGGGIIGVMVENVTIADDAAIPLVPGKHLKVSFSDNGIGISEKNLSRIFDPYFTTKQKGSGLGLATVYSIINNHDGFIEVESELEVGTTFTFYLPASEKLPESLADMQYQQEEEFKGEGRVLIMDDEEIVRDVAGEMISHIGFEVDFARHGEEALEKFIEAKHNGKPFDVVIMDLTIPGGMGGADAIKKLLEIDPAAKAIVSSGYSNNPVMANYRDFGFSGMVSKPFHYDEMAKTLENALKSVS
jgi:CheY-like chemotaxis protein